MELAFVFGTNGSIRNALLQDPLFGTTIYCVETPKKTFFHAHQTIISRDSEVIATLEMHDYSPGSVTVHHDESDRRITPSKELTLTGKSSHYMFRGSDGYKYRWRFDGDCYAEATCGANVAAVFDYSCCPAILSIKSEDPSIQDEILATYVYLEQRRRFEEMLKRK